MAIDYFSMWIEANALVSTTKCKVMKFLKSIIIYRYEIPNVLVNDSGPQFVGKELKLFSDKLNIEDRRASV